MYVCECMRDVVHVYAMLCIYVCAGMCAGICAGGCASMYVGMLYMGLCTYESRGCHYPI